MLKAWYTCHSTTECTLPFYSYLERERAERPDLGGPVAQASSSPRNVSPELAPFAAADDAFSRRLTALLQVKTAGEEGGLWQPAGRSLSVDYIAWHRVNGNTGS